VQQAINKYNYLRPLRTAGTRPPLFCFFPGPPGARDLADSLPADQPVYEFYYPNLDGASKFPEIAELASAYIEDIRKVQANGPYQLCGYSKAGLLAYETARLFTTTSEPVSLLALFETWHPRFLSSLSPVESIHFRLSYIYDRALKYCVDLYRADLGAFRVRVQEAVVRRAKMALWRATRPIFQRANLTLPKGVQSTEATAVLKDFVPEPYPNRILLVRTNDKFEMRLKDQTFGWGPCASQGVEIIFVRGDHETMKDQPFVQSLADKLALYLL
jgi:thioesterase domain-containing protein